MGLDSRKFHGGKYLKADDLKGKGPVKVTISRVDAMEDKGAQKLYVEFANSEKRLTLNTGNRTALEAAFGFDTDAWVGKGVVLTHDPSVRYQGALKGGIKLTVAG
jgi:hypothetical protein